MYLAQAEAMAALEKDMAVPDESGTAPAVSPAAIKVEEGPPVPRALLLGFGRV